LVNRLVIFCERDTARDSRRDHAAGGAREARGVRILPRAPLPNATRIAGVDAADDELDVGMRRERSVRCSAPCVRETYSVHGSAVATERARGDARSRAVIAAPRAVRGTPRRHSDSRATNNDHR
jgi:hypothetical protein